MAEGDTTTQPQEQVTATPSDAATPQNTSTEKVVVAGQEIIERLDLPTPNAWVELLMNPKADIIEKMAADGTDASKLRDIVPYLIRKWNFVDQNQTPLEITPENCNIALSLIDTNAILNHTGLAAFMSDAKKNK